MSTTKKALQTATVEATVITRDLLATQRAIRAAAAASPAWGVKFSPRFDVGQFRDLSLMHLQISYTARGANRDDINRRFCARIPAEAVLVAPRAVIKKVSD